MDLGNFVLVIALLAGVFGWGEWWGFVIIGAAMGIMLPDKLEPATNYKHRDFFHSGKMLKILLIATLVAFGFGFLIKWAWWLTGLCVGCVIHLLRDSTTTMGLPKK